MWKLRRIHATNLMSFKELEYTLTQGVTTLIFGNNLDNDSQKSNGSGKSALIEAISIGTVGVPLRKVKGEEVINDAAESADIDLEYVNDSSTEVFYIFRTISRKGASVVVTKIERDGEFVDTDEAVKSSVDEYNKYILEKLGVTKDEIFNNFILSEHKYQDFLSSSDKDKKEIINNFSNGNMVDKAIDKLLEDKSPVETQLQAAQLKVSNLDGRVEMLVEQIKTEEEAEEQNTQAKPDKKKGFQNKITEKREYIRLQNDKIEAIDSYLDLLEKAEDAIHLMEDNKEVTIEECTTNLKGLLVPLHLFDQLTDWNDTVQKKKHQLALLSTESKDINKKLKLAEDESAAQTSSHKTITDDYEKFVKDYGLKVLDFDSKIRNIKEQSDKVELSIKELQAKNRELNSSILDIDNKLAGTVTCPKCSHKFIIADAEFDVLKSTKLVASKKLDQSKIQAQIDDGNLSAKTLIETQTLTKKSKKQLEDELEVWELKLQSSKKSLNKANDALIDINRKLNTLQDNVSSIEAVISGVIDKMIVETLDITDAKFKSSERQIKAIEEDIETTKGSIETLESSIKELDKSSDTALIDSLRVSLKEFRSKSSVAIEEKNKLESKLNAFNIQEQIFVEFKTYLANTKIEALSKITNEFLESIGSDIRIRFSGYTVLKSGKVRDKISISLIRDGVDCGSFGKFSKGERARVNLANILAMSKLINVNCEDGKGLDLLVLDEILDGSDEDGLAHIFEALNNIGVTALIVSHGNIAENYPYRLVVNKKNGESKIMD